MSDPEYNFDIDEEDPEEVYPEENLSLTSLEIKNFRCLKHLVIDRIGRVNLIVGKISVGKTTLLEALWLFASAGAWPIIHKILYDRNELVRYNLPASSARYELIEAFRSFFTKLKTEPSKEVSIHSPPGSLGVSPAEMADKIASLPGKSGGSDRLPVDYFSIGCKNVDWDPDFREDGIYITAYKPIIMYDLDEKHRIKVGGMPKPQPSITLDWPNLPEKEYLEYDVISQSKKDKTVYIPVQGLNWQSVSTYWDDIALTDNEDAIVTCLKCIDENITRFTFKGDNMKDRVRYSVCKTERFNDPAPIATMGEGMQRILSLALAMTTASNGYLLIDEFETGLHHSIQAKVWREVFKLAHEWDVQVFATTHSWDCVKAFQTGAAEDQNEQAMLIRLTRGKNGQIRAVSYDEEELSIATEQNIEVR